MASYFKACAGRILVRPGGFYFAVLTVLLLIQLGNLLAFLSADDWVQRVLPTYTHILALTLGTLFMFRAIQLIGALLWAKLHGPRPLPVPLASNDANLPIVTVQVPLRNEPIEVARTAIDAALALTYPSERLDLQVIDNSDGSEYSVPIAAYLDERRFANPGGPSIQFLHRDGTDGHKAGNLNLGRKSSRGAFFLILDADSTVPPDTLLNALPIFHDPATGFVQLRIDPINEDDNIVTRAAAVTIRARYMTMQVRDAQGLVQFDGHNGIFRASALASIGGWSEEVSEDLATSVRMILAGHRGRYLDLPSGELLPTTFHELYKQRRRWAQGTAAFLKKEGRSILRDGDLRWYERLDLSYASVNILVEASVWVLLFAFAPLPILTFVQILLVMSVIPALVASPLKPGPALKRQVSLIFVISAILPGLVEGTLRGLTGRTAGFAVTQKIAAGALGCGDLLRVYGIPMLAAVSFFAFAVSQSSGFASYLNTYLPGTIIMSATILVPVLLNARKRLPPPAATAQAIN